MRSASLEEPSILEIELNRCKLLRYVDRLNSLARGKGARPLTLELDVSSVCDHDCAWCVDPCGSHNAVIMPTRTAERILREAWLLGARGVVFKGGGESTNHPDLATILKRSAELGFEVGIVTNGAGLGRPPLIEALVTSASYVRVSIDGPNRAARKELHGVDDFDGLRASLAALVRARGGARHPVIGATYCLDYERRHLIPECIRLSDRLGLDYALIRPPFCEEVGFPAPHTAEQAAELRSLIRETAAAWDGDMTVLCGNWVGDAEMKYWAQAGSANQVGVQGLWRHEAAPRPHWFNGAEHITGRCLACELMLVVSADTEVFGCCCLRGLPEYSFGRIDFQGGHSLSAVLDAEVHERVLGRMKRAECIEHCTHPLRTLNEAIEYLRTPGYHSSFI